VGHGGGAANRSTRVTDVLATHEVLDQLADRIEQAYSLRRPRWLGGCSTSRVWYMASLRLWEAHSSDPERIPLDPELFVASQPISVPFSDPWAELAHPQSARRYRTSVRQIIRQLRAELKREVVAAERSIRQGHEVGRILSRKTRGRSSLGSYIVARRAGRDDLADRFAAAAAAQHRSCPLYRLASLAFIPDDFYLDQTLFAAAEASTSSDVFAPAAFSRHVKYKECAN
jgi:hypothetical protein